MRFGWIGWCYEDNHDKVWGYVFTRENTRDCFVFCGGRGKKLQFKRTTEWDATDTASKKKRKGYKSVDEAKLRSVWETFDQDLEYNLSFALLSNRVK